MPVTALPCTFVGGRLLWSRSLAAPGADGVTIDFEHGEVNFASAHAMIAATTRTNCAPLFRVAQNHPLLVKHALALGAEGICFSRIGNAADTCRAVAAMRYPPLGLRVYGPVIAQSGHR